MPGRALTALTLALSLTGVSGAARAYTGEPAPIQPTAFVCEGAEAVAGHKLASANGLKVASDPKACFSHMSMYGGPRGQVIAVAPSPSCTGGRVLEVYEQSNAGPWYSFFEQPVCGAGVTVGPKSPWGDWMLTINGVHYMSKGAYYIPVK